MVERIMDYLDVNLKAIVCSELCSVFQVELFSHNSLMDADFNFCVSKRIWM